MAKKKPPDISATDKKKYVVMAISYSYNDEWYYREDGDSGRPETVFDTKQKAEVEAHKRDVSDRLGVDNPFEYLGEGNEEYDDCVSMPYYQWFGWLRDRDVEPPTESPDEKPNRDRLEEWWAEGVGGRKWQPGGYRDVKGVWSDEQKRTAAEHVAVAFYEVVEVDYGQ